MNGHMGLEEIKALLVSRHYTRICNVKDRYTQDQIKHQLGNVFDEAYRLGLERGWAYEQGNEQGNEDV